MANSLFSSKLAPYIEGLIREKRANGYIYQYEEYILTMFDAFIIKNGFDNGSISKTLIMEWSTQRPVEGKNYRNHRVSFVRQLSLYMLSLGLDAYVPPSQPKDPTPDPYILSSAELSDFFWQVDNFAPLQASYRRMAGEYSVLFRLYYCCGLRRSEGIYIKRKDVDTLEGRIAIRQSKGDKDRLVYMSDDMASLCERYASYIKTNLPDSEWFFPGRDPAKPFCQSSIDVAFNNFWDKTGHSGATGKNPTVHSLRHTYVVAKLNEWMKEGKDTQNLKPYLSRQLGHASVSGTQYYYHTSVASSPVIRKLDKTASKTIPSAVGVPVMEICSPEFSDRTKTHVGRSVKPGRFSNNWIPEVKLHED